MPLPAVIAGVSLPTIVAFILKALVAHLIMRVITVFGIAMISYVTIDVVMGRITNYLNTTLGTVSGDARTIADMLGFFDCMSIIISAYVASVAIRQLRGLYNRLVFGQSKGA